MSRLVSEGRRLPLLHQPMRLYHWMCAYAVFSEQIFLHGFVHSDPHPGNVLVQKHGGHTKIVLLDHGHAFFFLPALCCACLALLCSYCLTFVIFPSGLYRELDDEFRLEYARLWRSLIFGDAQGLSCHLLCSALLCSVISHHSVQELSVAHEQ